jgi:ribonuclease HI
LQIDPNDMTRADRGNLSLAKNKVKYYAVAVGRKPGIYRQWYGQEGAERQIKGYAGAVFKSFPSKEAATAFLKATADGDKSNPGQDKSNRITIFTDGGAINNPGPGGYGVVILEESSQRELSGGFRWTTNNRMELMACIVALKSLKLKSSVILYTDSSYVVNGIEKGWAKSWRANNWIKSDKKPALNKDLWEALLDLSEKHRVTFRWVKGHAGNEGNERCDALVKEASARDDLPADKVYEVEHPMPSNTKKP